MLVTLGLALGLVGVAPARAQEPTPGACSNLGEPLEAQNTGLTNMGFETGDFTGWTVGDVTDSVAVTGADAYTSPWEGEQMAVLGTPTDSAEVNQPLGPNEICQDFVVTQESEQFVFNVFTYDYTGFDELRFDVAVTDPATGEVLAAYEQGAWGSGTALKSTGWRGVVVDLAGRVGETVRLTLSAGGTSDSLYAFWAYLDSADELPLAPPSDAKSASGSVMIDPVTGQFTVAMPAGDVSDVTIFTDLTDLDCTATDVKLLYDGVEFPIAPVSEGSSVYTGVIPAATIIGNPNGQVVVEVTCEDGTTQVLVVGTIVLYDPSGIVSDAETGEPVVGA
ncbi:MAG: hypothetical protein WD080_12650, partial [Egibacteraceae bacterium]